MFPFFIHVFSDPNQTIFNLHTAAEHFGNTKVEKYMQKDTKSQQADTYPQCCDSEGIPQSSIFIF